MYQPNERSGDSSQTISVRTRLQFSQSADRREAGPQ
jgi:hypothetical protein